MVKTAELEMIKIAAFNDEFEKIAAGFAATMLTKALPKLMMNIAKTFGSAGGKNMIAGRGASGGAYKFLRAAGKKGWGARQTMGVGNKLLARKFGIHGGRLQNHSKIYKNRRTSAASNPDIKARPWIGTEKASIGVAKKQTQNYGKFFGEGSNKLDWIKNRPKAWLGEAAENIRFMQEKGVGGYIKNQMREAKTFTKTVGGKDHIFQRSMVGRTLNPVLSTGVGMGGLTFMSKTDNAGRKKGLAKRTVGGVGEAALWSIAPGAAMAGFAAQMVPAGARGIKGLATG